MNQRIEEYNRENKALKKERSNSRRNRRIKEGESRPKRKVRTTITPEKLDQMNRIFRQYEDAK